MRYTFFPLALKTLRLQVYFEDFTDTDLLALCVSGVTLQAATWLIGTARPDPAQAIVAWEVAVTSPPGNASALMELPLTDKQDNAVSCCQLRYPTDTGTNC